MQNLASDTPHQPPLLQNYLLPRKLADAGGDGGNLHSSSGSFQPAAISSTSSPTNAPSTTTRTKPYGTDLTSAVPHSFPDYSFLSGTDDRLSVKEQTALGLAAGVNAELQSIYTTKCSARVIPGDGYPRTIRSSSPPPAPAVATMTGLPSPPPPLRPGNAIPTTPPARPQPKRGGPSAWLYAGGARGANESWQTLFIPPLEKSSSSSSVVYAPPPGYKWHRSCPPVIEKPLPPYLLNPANQGLPSSYPKPLPYPPASSEPASRGSHFVDPSTCGSSHDYTMHHQAMVPSFPPSLLQEHFVPSAPNEVPHAISTHHQEEETPIPHGSSRMATSNECQSGKVETLLEEEKETGRSGIPGLPLQWYTSSGRPMNTIGPQGGPPVRPTSKEVLLPPPPASFSHVQRAPEENSKTSFPSAATAATASSRFPPALLGFLIQTTTTTNEGDGEGEPPPPHGRDFTKEEKEAGRGQHSILHPEKGGPRTSGGGGGDFLELDRTRQRDSSDASGPTGGRSDMALVSTQHAFTGPDHPLSTPSRGPPAPPRPCRPTGGEEEEEEAAYHSHPLPVPPSHPVWCPQAASLPPSYPTWRGTYPSRPIAAGAAGAYALPFPPSVVRQGQGGGKGEEVASKCSTPKRKGAVEGRHPRQSFDHESGNSSGTRDTRSGQSGRLVKMADTAIPPAVQLKNGSDLPLGMSAPLGVLPKNFTEMQLFFVHHEVRNCESHLHYPRIQLREGERNLGSTEELRRRLEQRQKQIAYGKGTSGYQNYRRVIPKIGNREFHNPMHPVTPRPDFHSSKRAFDKVLNVWRRQLHKWDHWCEEPTEEEEESNSIPQKTPPPHCTSRSHNRSGGDSSPAGRSTWGGMAPMDGAERWREETHTGVNDDGDDEQKNPTTTTTRGRGRAVEVEGGGDAEEEERHGPAASTQTNATKPSQWERDPHSSSSSAACSSSSFTEASPTKLQRYPFLHVATLRDLQLCNEEDEARNPPPPPMTTSLPVAGPPLSPRSGGGGGGPAAGSTTTAATGGGPYWCRPSACLAAVVAREEEEEREPGGYLHPSLPTSTVVSVLPSATSPVLRPPTPERAGAVPSSFSPLSSEPVRHVYTSKEDLTTAPSSLSLREVRRELPLPETIVSIAQDANAELVLSCEHEGRGNTSGEGKTERAFRRREGSVGIEVHLPSETKTRRKNTPTQDYLDRLHTPNFTATERSMEEREKEEGEAIRRDTPQSVEKERLEWGTGSAMTCSLPVYRPGSTSAIFFTSNWSTPSRDRMSFSMLDSGRNTSSPGALPYMQIDESFYEDWSDTSMTMLSNSNRGGGGGTGGGEEGSCRRSSRSLITPLGSGYTHGSPYYNICTTVPHHRPNRTPTCSPTLRGLFSPYPFCHSPLGGEVHSHHTNNRRVTGNVLPTSPQDE